MLSSLAVKSKMGKIDFSNAPFVLKIKFNVQITGIDLNFWD